LANVYKEIREKMNPKKTCGWQTSSELYLEYHDKEWAVSGIRNWRMYATKK